MKKIFLTFLCMIFSIESFAQITSPFIRDQNSGNRSGFEFYVGRDMGSPLITVDILSGVREPGVYHVPIHTDFAQLFSYAGGITESADVSEVRVRRTQGTERTLMEYNLNKEFDKKMDLMIVQDRDVIQIPYKTNLDSTIKWTTLVATIASVLVSAVLIADYKK